MTQEQRRIIESYDKRIAEAENYVDEIKEKYNKAGSLRKDWYKGQLEAAENKVDNLRKQKAKQLRRLSSNESASFNVSPYGVGVGYTQ